MPGSGLGARGTDKQNSGPLTRAEGDMRNDAARGPWSTPGCQPRALLTEAAGWLWGP